MHLKLLVGEGWLTEIMLGVYQLTDALKGDIRHLSCVGHFVYGALSEQVKA
jgi:hypothetical protein